MIKYFTAGVNDAPNPILCKLFSDATLLAETFETKDAEGFYSLYSCDVSDKGDITSITFICRVATPFPMYQMTREQNVFVAKRNIVDYIFKSAKLEGLGVTYPDTDTIFNGIAAQGVRVDDVIAINNLKRAWRFLLETLDPPCDYPYVCKLNQLVGGDNLIYDAGFIRKLPVTIGGTKWVPEYPEELGIKETLKAFQCIHNPTSRAIKIMLYCMRGQFFLDGNKRTAMLAANKEMISNGQGIISVPVESQEEFKHLLIAYYETGDEAAITRFIYDMCIDGLNL